MSSVTGKVVLVTGGSRGIGRSIVDSFVTAGAVVYSCGRGERPEDLAQEVVWIRADITQVQEVQKIADMFKGGIDVLINNAGVQVEKTVAQTTDEDWDLVMNVNAKALFMCCRAIIPLMERSGGGSIINIGSISGRVADPQMAVYNASKSFVHGLTRSIAVDHGKEGIRCNAICPGWIMTEMAEAGFDLANDPSKAKQDALDRHSSKRFGEPKDIANTALWLASDEAEFVTGQEYVVDGGLTAVSSLRPSFF